MKNPKSVALQIGEHSDIFVTEKMSGEIVCQEGKARIMNHRLGIGWSIRGGESCLLRRDTRYRVTAITNVLLSVVPKTISIPENDKGGKS